MGLRIPWCPTRRYLTGTDWLVGMFDHVLKRSSGTGNTSQIILELEQSLPLQEFQDALERFAAHFPVLRGRARRDWNLAPYWKIPDDISPPRLRVHALPLAPGTLRAQTLAALADATNDPFRDDTEHLVFRWAGADRAGGFLGMQIDHKLFDARGAELFLRAFQNAVGGTEEEAIFRVISLVEPARLDRWKEKFAAGRRVNRTLLALRSASHPLLDWSRVRNYRTAFRFHTFSPEQAVRICESADRTAGYLMLFPYLFAAGVRSFHRVFSQQGIRVPDYIIPASFDRRPAGDAMRHLFFNHVSFVFFRIRVEDIPDTQRLIRSVQMQLYENRRAGLLEDYEVALDPMRILPLPILAWLARLPLRGQFGSFAFSYVGQAAFDSPELFRIRVRNLLHAPRVPAPPGLGFFFNQYHNTFNLTLSYLPDAFPETAADAWMNSMAQLGEGRFPE